MNICPRCGKALEVTHTVMGRERTHPCACRCMIEEFERTQRCAERNSHEVHSVRETGGQGEATGGQGARLHA
jgi:hypothetical protein